ncbi:Quinone oxidoreductase [Hondaea fermentalgiana]|uniref:Quinone oxidoreductase n=1 Tax=Hondaea fermentalgiana TaxID=2315210 RepID=A0A2R5GSJ5_9STRA|nr:Quinone oxidoreductase [Hondaea fermentalgiana]|eukprot:GBG32728.1 Quinone oxidoreductase [Hondaea fermentalgiana]
MRAVVCKGKGSVEETLSEVDDYAEPEVGEHDLLVEVKAAAVNPVDCKNRAGNLSGHEEKILGYDGCGVVRKVGAAVKGFEEGAEVMFAGDITKPVGSNCEKIAIDARICAKKPSSLSFAEAAALPLVYLTAWELLFENLRLPTDGSGEDLVFMMLNGAGGVGSAAIQLARHVLGCKTVIASASRPETEEWCKSLGATHILNHRNDFEEELKRLGIDKVDVCFCGVDLDDQFDRIVAIMRPGGRIGSITVGDGSKIDVNKAFFPMRLTISFELMFTRPMFGLEVERQGAILAKVAEMYDNGTLKKIDNKHLKGLNKASFAEAHELQESGKAVGKITIEY